MEESEFTVIDYPASRQFTMDTGRISNNKHFVRALLEVDVTDALQKIKQARTREHKVSFQAWLIRLGLLLPQWARLAYMRWFILGNPPAMQKMMGTVMVTSLGTTGRLSGWIIPTAMHPLSIGIGSLNKKPAFVGDAVQKRDVLHLTVTIDHDVIDGMPAMRFVDDFVSRLERGDGLDAAQ
jgi:hypothetical protein